MKLARQNVEFGELLEISIKINSFVDPPFDCIQFTDISSKIVEPVAYLKNKESIKYYFQSSPEISELLARVTSPFDRYFKDEIRIIPTKTNQPSNQDQWISVNYSIAGLEHAKLPLEEFLAPMVKVKIQANLNKLNKISYPVKYFVKEDSFTYHEPELYDIKEPILWKEPYSIIQYWAAVEIANTTEKMYLLSGKGSFTIKDRMISDFQIKDHTYQKFPFPNKINQIIGKPLSWLEINVNDIKAVAGKTINSNLLELSVWRDWRKLEETTLNILQKGKLWLVPIAFSSLFKPLYLLISINVKGANSKGYASTFKAFYVELVNYNKGFKIRITDDQSKSEIPIPKSSDIKEPIKVPLNALSEVKLSQVDKKYQALIKKENESVFIRLTDDFDCVFCLC